MKVFVILGTGTNVGKTYLTCKMIEYLKLKGKSVFAIKPVISGFDKNQENDLSQLINAMKNNVNEEEISCYRLKEPLSPNIAAKYEGLELSYSKILSFCQKHIAEAKCDYLLIETAGGAFSPLTNNKMCCDLVRDIPQAKAILIANNYLGAISHSISAITVTKPNYFIFNEQEPNKYSRDVFENIRSFSNFQNAIYYENTLEQAVFSKIFQC